MLLHAFIPASRANGPGLRAVVFFQGCDLNCRGCWNIASHPFHGRDIAPDGVARLVLDAHATHGLGGVTSSGGEPMQQAASLLELIGSVRSETPAFSFGMFSGYTERELATGRYHTREVSSESGRLRIWRDLSTLLDFAVLGRFNQALPANAPLRTSCNQVLCLFSRRYSMADFEEQSVEVTVGQNGGVQLTGFPTLGLPF
jgi:anaerobic ribonucleoside-triphosphate reductase activating protein